MKELEPNITCLILFRSVHDVIKSEKQIKRKGFDYQIIPVPSDISSECGMCIEINKTNSHDVSSLLDQNSIIYNLYSK